MGFWEKHAFLAQVIHLLGMFALFCAVLYAVWQHNIAAIMFALVLRFLWHAYARYALDIDKIAKVRIERNEVK